MSATVKHSNPDGVKNALKKITDLKGKVVAVGFPKGKVGAYPDGTSVISVAQAHVFGLGVPQRDFMALARPDIIKKTKRVLREISKAKTASVVTALQNAAGQVAVTSIKQAITDLSSPPNSPETIRKKGSSNPLIDTTLMQRSVTYVIRDKT